MVFTSEMSVMMQYKLRRDEKYAYFHTCPEFEIEFYCLFLCSVTERLTYFLLVPTFKINLKIYDVSVF